MEKRQGQGPCTITCTQTKIGRIRVMAMHGTLSSYGGAATEFPKSNQCIYYFNRIILGGMTHTFGWQSVHRTHQGDGAYMWVGSLHHQQDQQRPVRVDDIRGQARSFSMFKVMTGEEVQNKSVM
ncbi:unnamed protein product, partial [Choristocarpus tenellus]